MQKKPEASARPPQQYAEDRGMPIAEWVRRDQERQFREYYAQREKEKKATA